MKLSHTERIKATLQGKQVDRLPYSFWTHFPTIDLDPYKLANATYEFCKEFEVDFIKNMPNGMYMAEAWSCECDYSHIRQGGVAKVTKFAIDREDDWCNLKQLDVTSGPLGRELKSLDYLVKKVNNDRPVIFTIFSPLTTASKICNSIQPYIENSPDALKEGLQTITEVTIRFAKEALKRGCAGVFFANQLASELYMTEKQYSEFGRPYDLKCLNAIKNDSWFNVMHLHGEKILFDKVKDYPVQAINWHIWDSPPTVEHFFQETDKVIVGGLQRSLITKCDVENLKTQIKEISKKCNKLKLILSPDCVIRYPVHREAITGTKDQIISLTESKDTSEVLHKPHH
ncbi:uroporphyrinogen decarboxylase family protein [Virgibacillus necropolis]|uniref:Uroporphyrinogen decarboxylase n=1 Tax=Virgibacillus necropolis TaxID=163877 RepID=A0A221M9U9_9BACI|nr:uroporphyrinogen decarboxylase family protein [Virgibacillus necropolis]ASN04391.1 uroporphyrinogen decarboxylase [Virgibacillus necropolis]